ncbi:MAG: hypothetical protein AAF850_12260, partial [Pseudomonadota bacterium]
GHSSALFGLPQRERNLLVSVFLSRHLMLYSKVQDARKIAIKLGEKNTGRPKPGRLHCTSSSNHGKTAGYKIHI